MYNAIYNPRLVFYFDEVKEIVIEELKHARSSAEIHQGSFFSFDELLSKLKKEPFESFISYVSRGNEIAQEAIVEHA